MITAQTAIEYARGMIDTPYTKYDCINFIKKIIRACPGGEKGYQVGGTNDLWKNSKHLTWKQESIEGARPGMLAFKVAGIGDTMDVHHVGLVTGDGTVIHSSSAFGKVVETNLYNGQWGALAIHKCIGVTDELTSALEAAASDKPVLYKALVATVKDPLTLRVAPSKASDALCKMPKGAILEVIDDSNPDWAIVRYDGMAGYAFVDYLERITDAEAEAIATTTTLISDSGNVITLLGRWRIAED